MGACLGNNQDNFQLHRFTKRCKKFLGGYFLTHTVDIPKTAGVGRTKSELSR